MSLEQLKAFLEKVKGDSNLQEKLKAAKSPEDVVGIAKEHGHEFTADKFGQLSEEELESLSGGTDFCYVNTGGWYRRQRIFYTLLQAPSTTVAFGFLFYTQKPMNFPALTGKIERSNY